MEDLILIGGGGHAKSVIDTIKSLNKFNIVGILDKKEKIGTYISDIKIIGTDDDLVKLYKKGIKNAFLTLGSIGSPKIRIKLYDLAKEIGYEFPQIIDPTAIISHDCIINEGVFISKGVIINTEVNIGKNAIINTGSIIEHESKIGDYVHIAPGSTLSGNVRIGNNTHVGTNSTIIQNINIGKNSIIGAGSIVLRDISENSKAYGVPAREV